MPNGFDFKYLRALRDHGAMPLSSLTPNTLPPEGKGWEILHEVSNQLHPSIREEFVTHSRNAEAFFTRGLITESSYREILGEIAFFETAVKLREKMIAEDKL